MSCGGRVRLADAQTSEIAEDRYHMLSLQPWLARSGLATGVSGVAGDPVRTTRAQKDSYDVYLMLFRQ